MRLFLYGITAAQWWARAASRQSAFGSFGFESLFDCVPKVKAIRYLTRSFPFLHPPFHVLVPSLDDKRALGSVVVHRCGFPFPKGSFVQATDGIYLPCPELCFMQSAQTLRDLEAIKEGYALCGSFALDERSRSGLAERAALTSAQSIRCYIKQNSSLGGSCKAARLIEFVKDGSASPRESDLAMRISLPMRLGGFGLKGAKLNYPLRLPDRQGDRSASAIARRYVADMCWPESKLVVEYDSDLHLTSTGIAHDARKRRELESAGYSVITVTKLQLDDPEEMLSIARSIASRLRKRLRVQIGDFRERQERLFHL